MPIYKRSEKLNSGLHDWIQETTQRIIKLLGLLFPDLLVKKCSYQTSLRVLQNQIDCKAGTTAKGQNLLANISTSRTSLLQDIF